MPGIDESKTVLVTGATSGIGRALARAIASLPSRPCVIAAGRRKNRLEELEKLGLDTIQVNLDTNKDSLKKFADDVLQKYPTLDTVVFCAGIQQLVELTEAIDLDKLASEINTNYISIISLISFFMPHFLKLAAQGQPCFFIPVSSGVGITPAPFVPNYSATKAALHSFSISLRSQLKGTGIHVLEIIPPLVESEINDPYGISEELSKIWMPLDEYTRHTMEALRKGDWEICVGMSASALERFEKGKIEQADAFYAHRPSLANKTG